MPQRIPAVLAILLLACLASFGYGMCYFFARPARMTLGPKLTGIGALISALVHFPAVLLMQDVSIARSFFGAAAYVMAGSLFWWTVHVNRAKPLAACFSVVNPLHLNTRGPYRLVRHPFYCSYLLACCGGVIATEKWAVSFTGIAMFFIYRAAALGEEEAFRRSPLAHEYHLYCSRVGRFFPKLSSLANLLKARNESPAHPRW